ncbi:MAG: demethoxyubiquinone hydroxylase family protein, partial [Porticoccaceae bacterium]|nr:demethoxyubiquinone hydroxylase family protein [Porticoccaceae bacterium]
MYNRKLSVLDQIITQIDDALRTVSSDAPLPERPSPANSVDDAELTQSERERAIGLMRVNHTGEICAQALYQGQALTAKLP